MQTIQFKVDDNALQTILSILQSLKQGMIEDISIVNNELRNDATKEIQLLSNHSANLVEEWKDTSEDDIWK